MLLAVVGGYLLTESATALLAWALAALGMARSEAVVLGMLLAFVLYLGLLVWAFAERRLARLWLVLGVGTLVAIGLAHVVQGAA
ncbi:MAG: iron uptake protein [Bacteroidota bacterium]